MLSIRRSLPTTSLEFFSDFSRFLCGGCVPCLLAAHMQVLHEWLVSGRCDLARGEPTRSSCRGNAWRISSQTIDRMSIQNRRRKRHKLKTLWSKLEVRIFDEVWDQKHGGVALWDNTGPCNSHEVVSGRTFFPTECHRDLRQTLACRLGLHATRSSVRMFPQNETGTRVHTDVPPKRKPERGYVRMFPWSEKPEPGPGGGEKKTNKHKQFRGIVPEMGGGQIVYVFPFFSWGKRETHKQNSQEISGTVPGQSRDNPGTIPWTFCLCVFLFIGFSRPLLLRNCTFVSSRNVILHICPPQSWGFQERAQDVRTGMGTMVLQLWHIFLGCVIASRISVMLVIPQSKAQVKNWQDKGKNCGKLLRRRDQTKNGFWGGIGVREENCPKRCFSSEMPWRLKLESTTFTAWFTFAIRQMCISHPTSSDVNYLRNHYIRNLGEIHFPRGFHVHYIN